MPTKPKQTEKPTCAHDELVEYKDGVKIGTCQKCGQEREYDPLGEKPPRVIKAGRLPSNHMEYVMQRHEFYERHKAEILSDVERIGLVAALATWRIPRRTWRDIRARWGLPGFVKAPKPAGRWDMPRMPRFNERWSEDLKSEWLRTYRALLEAGNGNSTKSGTEAS